MTAEMWLRVIWASAVVTVRCAAAVPKATPTPPTPVQISTTSHDAKLLVLTYDTTKNSLVFAPPTNYFWILKQTWRDMSPSAKFAYISLEVRMPGPQSQSSTQTFITRTPGKLLRTYGANESFASYKDEDRLMSSRCCLCGNGLSPTSFYWNLGNIDTQTTILSATTSEDASAFMVLNSTKVLGDVSCPTSGLNILTYPYVEEIGLSSLRRKRSTETYRTQLIFDYGISSYIVTVVNTNNGRQLSLVPHNGNACKKETWFYYKQYKGYHINRNGEVVEGRCVTLQHAMSGDYVVADVSSTIMLNAEPGQSGLVLQNPSLFDDDVTQNFLDYRFFTIVETVLPLTINSSLTIQTMCSFFYRGYCVHPNYFRNSLELSPIGFDDSRTPTFEDPPFRAIFTDDVSFPYQRSIPRGGAQPKFNGFPTSFARSRDGDV